MGSTTPVLQQIEIYLKQHYPAVKIAGMYSPPFGAWTDDDYREMAQRINDSGAHLVFVALGCPKQEKWMYQQRGSVQAVMLGVGWAFYVLAGVHKRAPHWMQETGLEWLYRLALEPTRLFKRYFVTNSWFCLLLLKQFVQQRFKM